MYKIIEIPAWMIPFVTSFVEKNLNDAKKACGEIGFPEKILLAHASLESGWGLHGMWGKPASEVKKYEPVAKIMQNANSFFGIKAVEPYWKGAKVEVPTWEYHPSPNNYRHCYETGGRHLISISSKPSFVNGQNMWRYDVMDYFRAYNTPYDAFVDYLKLIRYVSYLPAFESAVKDPGNAKKYAWLLGAGGYYTADKEMYSGWVQDRFEILSKYLSGK